MLRPAEARRIRDSNRETYYPSRSGESRSKVSSDSSSSDGPWVRADNEDTLPDTDDDMDEPRDWGNTWSQYQPWVVTDEFWEETPRMEGWQEAAPTMMRRDDNVPTTRTWGEAAPMDVSPTKRRTGTVPAKLSNANNKMRWAEVRPDRRHRHQSSGKERRALTNNRSRNLSEHEELRQDIQQRETTGTNPEPVPETPTSARIPAGPYMDHEDRRRKPATTADRRQRRKSERGEARDKVQSKSRQKPTLLEKLAGPLMIPGLPRSRRNSPERGDGPDAVRGGGQKIQTPEDRNSGENRNKPEDPDPEQRQSPDQETAGGQAVQKIREKFSYSEIVSGKPGAQPGQKAHVIKGDLKKDKKGQNFTLNLRAGSKAKIGAGKFHAIQVKGIKENFTFKDCLEKKILLSPTLKNKGLRISRIFDREIDGKKQLWMILHNTNSNFHFQVCRGQRLAELDRRSKPV